MTVHCDPSFILFSEKSWAPRRAAAGLLPGHQSRSRAQLTRDFQVSFARRFYVQDGVWWLDSGVVRAASFLQEVGEVLAEGAWESRARGLWVSAEPRAGPPRDRVYLELENLDCSVYGRRGPGHQPLFKVCVPAAPWRVPLRPQGSPASPHEHVCAVCLVTHGFLYTRCLVRTPYFSLLIQGKTFM